MDTSGHICVFLCFPWLHAFHCGTVDMLTLCHKEQGGQRVKGGAGPAKDVIGLFLNGVGNFSCV